MTWHPGYKAFQPMGTMYINVLGKECLLNTRRDGQVDG